MQQSSEALVKSLLVQSPPGEFESVLSCLKTLLGRGSEAERILALALPAACREHNLAASLALPLPDDAGGGWVLLCSDGEVPGGGFLAWPPGCGDKPLVAGVDHVARRVVSTRPAKPSERPHASVEPFRASLAAAAGAYAAEAHPNGAAAVYASVAEPKDGGRATLIVVLSAAAQQRHNFWSGSARSRWSASFDFGGLGVRLEGRVGATVFCAEDGAVTLTSAQGVTAESRAESAEAFGKTVVAAIRLVEAGYYSSLGECVDSLSQGTYKALRRALPLTRQKFGWEDAGHKLAFALAARQKAAARAQ